MLDPQVQIRIIVLAKEWAAGAMPRDIGSPEAWFNQMTEKFDKAYKAILKTIAEK